MPMAPQLNTAGFMRKFGAMASSTSARPSWQRGPIFQFFASLKLAVVLLAVLIVASIAGTIYESSFDAKVARAYIYGAPWFNLWLVLLAANLAVSALSRWPWRKHHVAFLVTHLGIITLLAGSLIGRIWGIEGTITLFKGEPPTDKLVVDEHQLRVYDTDGVGKGYRAEFLHHQPTPERPVDLGKLASGARLSIVDYAEAMDAKLNPRPVAEGGMPALHFTMKTAMMGQQLDSWLLAGDPQHRAFEMGLATIEVKRGRPERSAAESRDPAEPGGTVAQRDPSTSLGMTEARQTEINESIFAFANSPQQIAHAANNRSSGAKISLSHPAPNDKGQLTISVNGKSQTVDVGSNLTRSIPLEGTSLSARIENYWPDFRIENGKPVSVSDAPNNPAVVVTISGRGVPAKQTAEHADEVPATGGPTTLPPVMNAANAARNHLTIFFADDGALTYELSSRKFGNSSGKLEVNKPLTTGWADWQFTADKFLPSAQAWMDFTSAKSSSADLPDGVCVRMEQNGQRFEQWLPSGWQINVPTTPTPTGVAYGFRTIRLPIGLELLNFEVTRNEGSDAPAGFKSTVRVTTADGQSATGQCWMNHPFSFPGAWWRAWTGLTFKMSQASWNPENLNQSTIQILRDPGWLLKWIGSVLIVVGVFLMFYVKQFRRPLRTPRQQTPAPEVAEAKPVAV